MNRIALEIDRELESLDRQSAWRFEQAMQAMLRLVKAQQKPQLQPTFAERIASHPAIGTWPKDIDIDEHVAATREEWDC